MVGCGGGGVYQVKKRRTGPVQMPAVRTGCHGKRHNAALVSAAAGEKHGRVRGACGGRQRSAFGRRQRESYGVMAAVHGVARGRELNEYPARRYRRLAKGMIRLRKVPAERRVVIRERCAPRRQARHSPWNS